MILESGVSPRGLNVHLTSSNVQAVVPINILVPSGQSSVIFTINTLPVTVNGFAIITAMLPSGGKTANLNINKPGAHPQIPLGTTASFRNTASEAPGGGAYLGCDAWRGNYCQQRDAEWLDGHL
jgi:hypothetical protein